jgi:hypothetical protein
MGHQVDFEFPLFGFPVEDKVNGVVPGSIRGKFLKAFLRVDVCEFFVRTLLDILEVVNFCGVIGFPCDLGGHCLVNEKIFGILVVDLVEVLVRDINHVQDGLGVEGAESSFIYVQRTTRLRAPVKL